MNNKKPVPSLKNRTCLIIEHFNEPRKLKPNYPSNLDDFTPLGLWLKENKIYGVL